MKNASLILGGGLLFALGVVSGTILLPARHQAAARAALDSISKGNENSVGRDAANLGGGDAIPADFGNRLENALHGATEQGRLRALYTIADGMTPEQIKGALPVVSRIASTWERSKVLDVLLGKWAAADPKGAIEYTMAMPMGEFRDSAVTAAATGWAQLDAKTAEAWAGGLKLTDGRNLAFDGIIDALGTSNPQEALELGVREKLPEEAAEAVFEPMTQEDPAKAAALLKMVTNREMFSNGVFVVVSEWAKQDPAAATAWAASLPNGADRNSAMVRAIDLWGIIDTNGAANFLLQLPPGSFRDDHLESTAVEWMREDSSEAMRWIRQLPSGETRERVIKAAASAVSASDPEQASELIGMTQTGDRAAYYANLAFEMERNDSDAGLRWIRQQTPEVQAAMMPNFVTQMAQRDPEGALKLIPSLPEKLQSTAFSNAMGTWGSTDPAAAGKYLENLPAGEMRDQEIVEVATSWMRTDSASATEWIDGMPGGTGKNGAVTGGATILATWDPAGAIKLLGQNADDATRQKAEADAAARWLRTDAAAATAWIQTSDLAPEVKFKLLQPK